MEVGTLVVNVDDLLMVGKPETQKNIKENINKNSNIQKSGKVKKFLGVYYEWGRDAKHTYKK